MNELEQELFDLLLESSDIQDVKVIESRNLDSFFRFLFAPKTLLCLGAIWTILQFWMKQKGAVHKCKIKYKAQSGENIEVELNGLTKSEVNKYMEEYPMEMDSKGTIIVMPDQ